jgi:hypothetical protein
MSSGESNNNAPKETATWTRFLPQAFGIREAIRQSPYRWCTRERCVCVCVLNVYVCCCFFLSLSDHTLSLIL